MRAQKRFKSLDLYDGELNTIRVCASKIHAGTLILDRHLSSLKVRGIQAKSLLTKSKLPESDYCINPYVGCSHACVYCYSRFMRRFTGHSNEKWGTFVDVKINASQILRKDLLRNPRKGVALVGSVTDGYQPLEKKYRITRGILEILLDYEFPFSVLTKSDLVLRDLDLLRQCNDCSIGVTITTLDENVRKDFEPYSTPAKQKVKALRTLHESGIRTYVFIGPILPYLTNIRSIIASVHPYVDEVWAETLNIRCGNWMDIETVLRNSYPILVPTFRKTVLDREHWDRVGKELKRITREFGKPLVGYYKH